MSKPSIHIDYLVYYDFADYADSEYPNHGVHHENTLRTAKGFARSIANASKVYHMRRRPKGMTASDWRTRQRRATRRLYDLLNDTPVIHGTPIIVKREVKETVVS